MDNILKHWGLSGESIKEIYKSKYNSTWDINGQYILKHNPNTEQLSDNIRLANFLAAENIPAVTYIKTTNGEWTTLDGKYCLMEKLKGVHVDFHENPEAIHELGRGLAQLHIALAKMELEIQCQDSDLLAEWRDWIKPGLANVSNEVVEQTEVWLSKQYKKLPRQPIHRDVHSHNIFFDDGKISGWVDFDLTQKNARIFDLAYLLGGLLAGKTDTPAKIELWKAIYRDLLAGYNKVNLLTSEETEALPLLMITIELLFVTYWDNNQNDNERNKAIALAEWLYNNCKEGAVK